MELYERMYLVFATILFIMNMALAVRNMVAPGAKAWLAIINMAAAFFVGISILNMVVGS